MRKSNHILFFGQKSFMEKYEIFTDNDPFSPNFFFPFIENVIYIFEKDPNIIMFLTMKNH